MFGRIRNPIARADARCIRCGCFYDPEFGHNFGICELIREAKLAREARGIVVPVDNDTKNISIEKWLRL